MFSNGTLIRLRSKVTHSECSDLELGVDRDVFGTFPFLLGPILQTVDQRRRRQNISLRIVRSLKDPVPMSY